MKHLYLDPLGGLAGDMFTAALADAFPDYAAAAIAAAETTSGASCTLSKHHDAVLHGARFQVADSGHHHHAHSTWRGIRDRLETAPLSRSVRDHAIAIFTHLATAEAEVHGVAIEAVIFHEVGNADSIADIVAAALLIDAVGPASWSIGALPIGGGRIETAHGVMTAPAPATALLLRGFEMVDDGIAGERVTPTGAAILRRLGCVPRERLTGRLERTGIGFGTRRLPGLSNVLRVLVFDLAASTTQATHRDLAVIGFEVDDQSAEDLATGLDKIRLIDGVHDVAQMIAIGKKGRIATHVQVLVRPDYLEAAIDACFSETTTIGLRTHLVQGHALPRRQRMVEIDGRPVRVKLVDRPRGVTGKAEADDVSAIAGHRSRRDVRTRAEQSAEAEDHE